MPVRFGFMIANKAGKCFYCKAEFAEGARCAMDNNIKRRTCAGCAERMIGEGAVIETAPDTSTLAAQVALLSDKLERLENRLKDISGDE